MSVRNRVTELLESCRTFHYKYICTHQEIEDFLAVILVLRLS